MNGLLFFIFITKSGEVSNCYGQNSVTYGICFTMKYPPLVFNFHDNGFLAIASPALLL